MGLQAVTSQILLYYFIRSTRTRLLVHIKPCTQSIGRSLNLGSSDRPVHGSLSTSTSYAIDRSISLSLGSSDRPVHGSSSTSTSYAIDRSISLSLSRQPNTRFDPRAIPHTTMDHSFKGRNMSPDRRARRNISPIRQLSPDRRGMNRGMGSGYSTCLTVQPQQFTVSLAIVISSIESYYRHSTVFY